MGEQTNTENAGSDFTNMSPADFRKRIRGKAMRALDAALEKDEKGILALKVMQGIGEFESAKQAVVINNFVSRVPADWAARYVGGGSTVPEERQLEAGSVKEIGDGKQ